MPMLTHPTAATITTTTSTTTTNTRTTMTTTIGHDPALARPGEPFRVRLAAALAATGRDGRPLTVTDRASAPTHRYRAMA